ncbi:MAG: saccharopine dehydrogenase family protein [bacterium]
MSLLSKQRGPIAVYGATGYTGRLVAEELSAAGSDFILSGRNQRKLDELAGSLDEEVQVQVASVDEPESLRSLLKECSVVIDCAGPFLLYGEPVLKAAVETGTHYLDTTGEQPYMKLALDRYSAPAREAGTAVIPGMGFDYVPGDMLAALTAEGMGELDEVTLAYTVSFQPTRGTMRSALEMMKGGDVEWRKLSWQPASQRVSRGHFDFGEPLGRKRMTRYPAGEQITVPQHISTRLVRTMLSADSLAPGAVDFLLPAITRPTSLMMRTPAKGLVGAAIGRLPEGASEEDRRSARFTIVCEVKRGKRIRRGTVNGRDVYGLTARLVTKGARICAERGFGGRGFLAPAQAFDPRDFLSDLDEFSFEWHVEPAAAEVAAS